MSTAFNDLEKRKDAVTDIFGDQIEINGQWFHAERIFGKPASEYQVGDSILGMNNADKNIEHPQPDEVVASDLFRESGANVSHTEEKIAAYAEAMNEYGGWGKFPPISARVVTITRDDVLKYLELDKAGYSHELAYSRALTIADVNKRIAHIENGHNRAYAAARCGIGIPVYDLLLQDQENERSCRASNELSDGLLAMANITLHDGTERPASNHFGKPIHPLEQGIRNFWNWFKESQVTNDDGKPLVVYHGSIVRPDNAKVQNMGDIEQFDRMFTTKFRAHSIDTIGSWFSSTPGNDGASLYSGNSAGSVIYPVYLSIQNPLVTTFQLMQRRARMLVNGKDDGRQIGQVEVDAFRQWLKGMGKDGIKIEGSGNDGSTEFDNQVAWIALEPEQIKSAIGNSGSFDPTSAHIAEPNGLDFQPVLKADNAQDLDGLKKRVVDWWDEFNPFEDEGLYASGITAVYLVGSRAKGTARIDSDFDVAVVFDKKAITGDLDDEDQVDFPTALKLSESLHMRFGASMPIWSNVDVDIQVFFSCDKELESYSKIELTSDEEVNLSSACGYF